MFIKSNQLKAARYRNNNNNNDLMVFHRVALLNHNAKNTKNKDYKYIYKFRKITNELRCYDK